MPKTRVLWPVLDDIYLGTFLVLFAVDIIAAVGLHMLEEAQFGSDNVQHRA